ncbi:hypothetical protein BDEG_21845 [Batrachochytrium dendrobatidis JEL423]|uniref:TFIID subunit TAF5 NTD2 domain-containing protein n=1 Tax=Batrachochytrium dendrobatidis (strain JEL423) TaxID=403673 RepID=A0A177WCW3_BATDL|nr:hypothetical protein BDEG_21845 [Batrachochytrium dendrobatidis JEL423]
MADQDRSGSPPPGKDLQASGITAHTQVSDRLVAHYLNQRGFRQAEASLRSEAKIKGVQDLPTDVKVDEVSIPNFILFYNEAEANNPLAYEQSYTRLRKWIDDSIDVYKLELRVILFPIFVHAYLDLVEKDLPDQAKHFFETCRIDHLENHSPDILRLGGIQDAQHISESDFVQNFRQNKYGVKMSKYAFELLLCFLQDNKFMLLLRITNQYVSIQAVSDKSVHNVDDIDPDDGAGLIGQYISQLQSFNREPLLLGRLPPDVQFLGDVEKAIALQRVEDTDELKQQIDATLKATTEPDAPSRENVPLPPRRRFEIQEEMDALRDICKQVRCSPSALPSICCYTFHNGYGGINTLRASPSAEFLAAGFNDSFIKLWSPKEEEQSRRRHANRNSKAGTDPIRPSTNLIGHSGPVFGLDFNRSSQFLLSSSEDKTIRLWSTHTKTNLVVFKGHNYPVFDVCFGPYDVYFASASHDRTARLWSCDHLFPLRVFVGHLSDVDTVRFHPNSNYLLTGSADRTCRLWDVQKGSCVRIFSKHQGAVSAVAISPDGRTMASGGDDKTIRLWDLGSGRRIKSMHGHNSFISSLEFSQDGSLLASGGIDDSVRLWDVKRADTHEIKMDSQISDQPSDGASYANMCVLVREQ